MPNKGLKIFINDVLPFIVGAGVVGGTTLIAQRFSTKLASIFWALPISMLPAIFLLHFNTKSQGNKAVLDLTKSNIPGMIVLTSFFVALWVALLHVSFFPAIGIALGVWVVMAAIYWMVVCPSPFHGGKCVPI
jgi:hypothetical protein